MSALQKTLKEKGKPVSLNLPFANGNFRGSTEGPAYRKLKLSHKFDNLVYTETAKPAASNLASVTPYGYPTYFVSDFSYRSTVSAGTLNHIQLEPSNWLFYNIHKLLSIGKSTRTSKEGKFFSQLTNQLYSLLLQIYVSGLIETHMVADEKPRIDFTPTYLYKKLPWYRLNPDVLVASHDRLSDQVYSVLKQLMPETLMVLCQAHELFVEYLNDGTTVRTPEEVTQLLSWCYQDAMQDLEYDHDAYLRQVWRLDYAPPALKAIIETMKKYAY